MDACSTKARSGSSPPIIATDRNAAIQMNGPLITEMTQTGDRKKAQDNLLQGIGSQFPVIGMPA